MRWYSARPVSEAPARDEHLFDEVKRYVGWSALDEARLLRVGPRVLQAFERLMGLILVAVAVEMLLRAVRTLAAQLGGG